MTVEVRKVTRGDVPEVAQALARAFADDPVMTYVIPERNRHRRMRRLFELDLHHIALRHDESYTTVGPISGAALWAPPDKWRTSALSLAWSAPSFLRVLGTNVRAAIRLMTAVERKHPKPPHYYLSTLGTEPDFQGKGIGSALIQPVLDRCDAAGVPAYLESSKEANVPFYRRHGFEITGEVTVADGPTLWLMWRDAQLSTTR
ncbi:MAG TPA: GNAT family N-acetyltransferase [Acidimicrobiales bacterium]|nr:GNAT family N-acetyltransferase [Acidimicrobiales bacterium]